MSEKTNNANEMLLSPRRLRKHSYKDAINAGEQPNIPVKQKMAGTLPDITEDLEMSDGLKLIHKDDFAKKSTNQKLDIVAEAMNKLYDKMNEVTKTTETNVKTLQDAVFDDGIGLVPQINGLVENARSVDDRIQSLTEENLQLRDELDLLKGIVHKISNQVQSADGKLNKLVAKSMEDNLVITGILDDFPKRNPRKQVHQFFHEELGLRNVSDSDVLKVFRVGKQQEGRHRPLMLNCTPDLRRYLMASAPSLKGRTNSNGGSFYINQQLPEAIAEQKREIREVIRNRQAKEEALPNQAKSTFLVRNDKVYINGQLTRKTIVPPSVEQLFPEDDMQKKINAIKLRTFRAKPEMGSIFRVSIFTPDSMDQVKLAYIKMFQNNPSADHIAVACIVNGEEAYNDNAEFGSGFRLLRSIKDANIDNVALFLTRQYGGVNLGPRRFNIMTNLAYLALEKVAESRSRLMEQPSSPSPIHTTPTGSPPSTPQRENHSSPSKAVEDHQQHKNRELNPNNELQSHEETFDEEHDS